MEWHSADEKSTDTGKPVDPPVVEEGLVAGNGGRL
jgi:hypothetical protein